MAGDHTTRQSPVLVTVTIRKVLPEPTPAIRKPVPPVLTASGTPSVRQHLQPATRQDVASTGRSPATRAVSRRLPSRARCAR